jgi:hypothetical protein
MSAFGGKADIGQTVANRRLRQFGDDLRGLFQRPRESGTAAYKPETAVGQRVFGDVVGVRRLNYLHQIVFAGGEKDLLDFAATFFGEILGRMRAFLRFRECPAP